MNWNENGDKRCGLSPRLAEGIEKNKKPFNQNSRPAQCGNYGPQKWDKVLKII